MIYSVIVDISNSQVDRVFDYISEQEYSVGQRVEVDFAHRVTEGYVVEIKDSTDCPPDKLKPILRAKDDFCAISPQLMQLGKYMQYKYNLRFIDILRLFVPSEMRGDRVKALVKRKATLACDKGSVEDILTTIKANAAKQRAVVEYLNEHGATLVEQLNADFGSAAVKSVLDKGIIVVNQIVMRRRPQVLTVKDSYHVPTLTQQQQLVADTVLSDRHGSYLLHGVTGSGKTEVYMTIIEKVVSQGKTCIMLVPEISLTPNVMRLFRDRFGDRVALLHSGLSKGERYDEWMRLKNGEAVIAIGARSAIFAPLDNIGAIIIDEEHDSSYVSESNPRYDAKEVALIRSGICGASLVLGSATPDMETYLRATEGKYRLLRLPDRISSHKLPDMEIVDMVGEFRSGNRSLFSYALSDAIGAALSRGEQVMLFLNRRGFASFVMCKECGYVAKCENCDVSLTYHKTENELKCHCCGKRYHALTKCPVCGSVHIRHGRTGTEKVVEELKQLFPEARVLRMDNDTTARKDSYFRILDAFAAHKADILVGTQMIAKGHDFASVTLVGILEADAALYFSDYRSSERTFQLVTQVAGRAGRADKAGRVILQTYAPRHYVFAYARTYDYEGFWRKEINTRKVTKFPPFTKVVRVLAAAPDEEQVANSIRNVYRGVLAAEGELGKFVYLGASKSPVTRMNGLVRYQVLMRVTPEIYDKVMPRVYALANENIPSKGSCFAETNPQSFV